MSWPLVFRPAAQDEMIEARNWYDARRPGLGQEFVAAVGKSLSSISTRPELYPRVHGETRRAVLRRFPYAVYFRVHESQVVVLGVVHGHRHPRVWKSRR